MTPTPAPGNKSRSRYGPVVCSVLLSLLALGLFAWQAVRALEKIHSTALWYDEGYNAVQMEALKMRHRYVFKPFAADAPVPPSEDSPSLETYNVTREVPFSPYVTTGYPVIGLAALWSSQQERPSDCAGREIVFILFSTALFLIFATHYSEKPLRFSPAGAILAPALFFFPLVLEQCTQFLGEAAAIAFLAIGTGLYAFFSLSFVSGLFIGLALSTKLNVLIISIVSAASLLVKQRGQSRVRFLLGFSLPLLALQSAEIFELGPQGYLNGKVRALEIYSRLNGGYLPAEWDLSFIAEKILAVITGFQPFLLGLVSLVSLLYFMQSKYSDLHRCAERFLPILWAQAGLAHIVWFLFIANSARPQHLFPGIALLLLSGGFSLKLILETSALSFLRTFSLKFPFAAFVANLTFIIFISAAPQQSPLAEQRRIRARLGELEAQGYTFVATSEAPYKFLPEYTFELAKLPVVYTFGKISCPEFLRSLPEEKWVILTRFPSEKSQPGCEHATDTELPDFNVGKYSAWICTSSLSCL